MTGATKKQNVTSTTGGVTDAVVPYYTTNGMTVIIILVGSVAGFLFMVFMATFIIWCFRRCLRQSPNRPHSRKYEPNSEKLKTPKKINDETMLPVHCHRRAEINAGSETAKRTKPNKPEAKNLYIINRDEHKPEAKNLYIINRDEHKHDAVTTNSEDQKEKRNKPDDVDEKIRTENSDIEIPFKTSVKRGSLFKLFEISQANHNAGNNPVKQSQQYASSDYDSLHYDSPHSESPSLSYFEENPKRDNFQLQKRNQNARSYNNSSRRENKENNSLDVRKLSDLNPLENVYRYLYGDENHSNDIIDQQMTNNNNGNMKRSTSDAIDNKHVIPTNIFFRNSNRINLRDFETTMLPSKRKSASQPNMQNPIYETEGSSCDGSESGTVQRYCKRRNGAVTKDSKDRDALAYHERKPNDVADDGYMIARRHGVETTRNNCWEVVEGNEPVRRVPSLGYVSGEVTPGEVTPEQTLHSEPRNDLDHPINAGVRDTDSSAVAMHFNNLREVTRISREMQSGDNRTSAGSTPDIGHRYNSNGNHRVKRVDTNFDEYPAENLKKVLVSNGNDTNLYNDNVFPRNQPIRYSSNREISKQIPPLSTYKSFLEEISHDLKQQNNAQRPEKNTGGERKSLIYIPKTSTLSSAPVRNLNQTHIVTQPQIYKINIGNKPVANGSKSTNLVGNKRPKPQPEPRSMERIKKWNIRESRDDCPNETFGTSTSSGLEFVEDGYVLVKKSGETDMSRLYVLPLHRNESILEYQHRNISYV